jgi:RNA polymerase sigma-70 factor (ECF subfamily)
LSLPQYDQSFSRESFAELFERYKNLVYQTAYLMLDDPKEAEDALQEVFVLVYKSLSGYDPAKGAFTTWLHRITINHCLMRRRKRRFLFIPLENIQHTLLDKPVENTLAEAEEKEAMIEAIRNLSDKQRAVIILRYYLELPYTEIAQVLDIPLGTVKSRLDGSLRTLRRTLSKQQEDIQSIIRDGGRS